MEYVRSLLLRNIYPMKVLLRFSNSAFVYKATAVCSPVTHLVQNFLRTAGIVGQINLELYAVSKRAEVQICIVHNLNDILYSIAL